MKDQSPGGRDAGIPPFKMPTLNKGMLWAKDSMRDGYHPKMLLYALDESFYIYVQVKNSWRADDKLVLAYKILCISTNHCTNRWNGVKRPACLMPWPCSTWRMFGISSASCGWCMMAYCWWACSPSFWVIALGAQCWLGYSNTSIGAMMMRPIARHRC